MDILTFIVELLKASSWPLVALLVLIFLRKELSQIIPRIQKVKWKDAEIEIAEIKLESKRYLETTEEIKLIEPEKEDLETRLNRLSEISQRAAILEAWRELENIAIKAINFKTRQAQPWNYKRSGEIEEMLIKSEILNPDARKLYSSLRRIRNNAAHANDFQMNEKAVIQYIELIMDWIRKIKEESEKNS